MLIRMGHWLSLHGAFSFQREYPWLLEVSLGHHRWFILHRCCELTGATLAMSSLIIALVKLGLPEGTIGFVHFALGLCTPRTASFGCSASTSLQGQHVETRLEYDAFNIGVYCDS